jgi:hypothetical protein
MAQKKFWAIFLFRFLPPPVVTLRSSWLNKGRVSSQFA